MNLAQSVRIEVDPEALLRDPWVHDMVHALAERVKRAQAGREAPSAP